MEYEEMRKHRALARMFYRLLQMLIVVVILLTLMIWALIHFL